MVLLDEGDADIRSQLEDSRAAFQFFLDKLDEEEDILTLVGGPLAETAICALTIAMEKLQGTGCCALLDILNETSFSDFGKLLP